MTFTDGLKASGNIVQETPQDFFDFMNKIFRFDLDVCALPENAKCKRFYTPDDDGLKQPWGGGIWCNPPYGKDIINWVRKASEEYRKPYCNFIVMLLPARTDTKWFQEYVYPYAYLWFIGGRLKFGGKSTSAPFPSVVAVYARRDR